MTQEHCHLQTDFVNAKSRTKFYSCTDPKNMFKGPTADRDIGYEKALDEQAVLSIRIHKITGKLPRIVPYK